MLTQAIDYRDECDALHAVLVAAPAGAWAQPTQFKSWTFDDVLGHLHIFDHGARLTVEDPEAFQAFLAALRSRAARNQSLTDYTREWLGGCAGLDLLQRWHSYSRELAALYAGLEPSQRVRWAGPDMSVRSCISARQMETWAHGQAVFDALGEVRQERDRVRNIVVMGVNTLGWSFTNRGREAPVRKPWLRLTSPSGATWEFNDPSDDERIEGAAVDFCRVVTQTRNVADTDLRVNGAVATAWMSIAQCFAGRPEPPPPPGTRFVRR